MHYKQTFWKFHYFLLTKVISMLNIFFDSNTTNLPDISLFLLIKAISMLNIFFIPNTNASRVEILKEAALRFYIWYFYVMNILIVFWYIFSAFTTSSEQGQAVNFTFVKFISQLFSSADKSLKDETRLLLLWYGSLVTLHTLCLYIYHR